MVESGNLRADYVLIRTPEAMPMELLQETLATRVGPKTSQYRGSHKLEPELSYRKGQRPPPGLWQEVLKDSHRRGVLSSDLWQAVFLAYILLNESEAKCGLNS